MDIIDNRQTDQRHGERRQFSSRTLFGTLFLYRRRQGRRADDATDTYVDWYEPLALAAPVLILLLCCLDAFMTLILLSHGAVELNIFMDWLIKADIQAFTIVKITATGLGLVVLVMHFNFRLFRLFSVRYLVFALVPLYALLFIYEINLLSQI